MRQARHKFWPSGWDRLESRVALSAGLRPTPALVERQTQSHPRRGPSPRISDQIDQAFDSFKQDYLEAQAAYLAAGAGMSLALPAFRQFVIQRVDLLSVQLTRTLSRLPGSLNLLPLKQRNRSPGIDVTLQAFLQRQITGTAPGSLRNSLVNGATPGMAGGAMPPPGTTGPTATLYTLTATNAIEAAHAATINAAKFLVSGVFRGKHDK